MTPQEKKLWYGFLRSYELPFVAQKVVGNYILDFYCRKVRLCVELDGGQHCETRAVRYDECRSLFLSIREIDVLRFSNREVNEEFEGVCETIHQTVESRRHDRHDVYLRDVLAKR